MTIQPALLKSMKPFIICDMVSGLLFSYARLVLD